MKKSLLTMLALLSIGSSAFAQGTVNVPTVVRKAGQVKEVSVVASRQGKVKVELQNSANYRDLQFDLTLPTGITVATEGTAVQDAASNHTVSFNAVADNKVRFVVYNDGQDDNVAEEFSNGIVVEIPVNVASSYSGTKAGLLDNIITSDEEAHSISLEDGDFNFRAVLLGDVTDDGNVDMADAQAIIFTFLGEAQPVFVEEAGNVIDSDTVINMADGQAVIFMYLESSGNAKSVVIEDDYNELDPE